MDLDWLRTLTRRCEDTIGIVEHEWAAVDRFFAEVEQLWRDRAALTVTHSHITPVRSQAARLFRAMRDHGALVQRLAADLAEFAAQRGQFNEAALAFQTACTEADGSIGEALHEAALSEERVRNVADRIADTGRMLSRIRQS